MIEVYIQSIILPSTKTDRTNEPIKDEEILAVFKESTFVKHPIKETGSASKSATGKSPDRGKDSSKGEKHSSKKGKDGSKKKKAGDSSKSLQSESEHAGMASKLLLMYYVLLYQETYISNIKILGEFKKAPFTRNVTVCVIDLVLTQNVVNESHTKSMRLCQLTSPLAQC